MSGHKAGVSRQDFYYSYVPTNIPVIQGIHLYTINTTEPPSIIYRGMEEIAA